MDMLIPGYEIIKEIAKGGMATVYLAIQQNFDRMVALKIMAPHLTGDPVFGERFLREARIVSRLNHRNIVPVFDVGHHGHNHYLAMEYLPGGDLKARLRAGLAAEDALYVVFEIANALAYAHAKSYIHRDIKPENILFREDGTVVLTDFGIAKAMDTTDRNMTSTGLIVGSPHYMSPEQALANPIDTRTDIYSLGVVLYETLTGRVMFDAGSSVAAAIKHILEPIPKLPEHFSQLQPMLEKMVAKEPDQRYLSGAEVTVALEPFLQLPISQWNTQMVQAGTSETTGGTRIIYHSGRTSRSGQHAAVARATPPPGIAQSETPQMASANLRKRSAFSQPLHALQQSFSALDSKWKLAGLSCITLMVLVILLGLFAGQDEMLLAPVTAIAEQNSLPELPAPAARNEVTTDTQVLQTAPEATLVGEPAETEIPAVEPAQTSQEPVAAPAEEITTTIAAIPAATEMPTLEAREPAEANPQATDEPIAVSSEEAIVGATVEIPLPEPSPITRHLDKASEALRKDRLKKSKDSAYHHYREVLKLQPGNPEALQGMEDVASRFVKLASNELNGGDHLDSAMEYAQNAKRIVVEFQLPDNVSQPATQMLEAVKRRVDDRDIMADIEKWNTILRDSDKVTEDDLNRAYTIYKNARNASIRDSRIDDACRIYSDAFFQMAKPVYKANNPDKSLDLIKKGLDINPNHEKLKKLHKRRVDHPDGKESIFD